MTVDLLLAHPVFLSLDRQESELMSPYFPLGLLYLAAFLRDRGYAVEIFDGTFLNGPDDFTKTIDEIKPRVVGVGALQPNRKTAMKLAEIAHRAGAIVVCGGPDPTRYPEKYLQDHNVDFVVHHEGELTLVELMDILTHNSKQPIRQVAGIGYRKSNGDIQINPRRPYLINLDELPIPARDLIDMDQYLEIWREHHGYASLTISVSRGCPYGCEWCQDAVHGPDMRQRSPQSVVEEVKALISRYPIDRLRLVDDVDGIDREWLKAWAEIARREGVEVPFEALNDLERKDIPMLDVRDTL